MHFTFGRLAIPNTTKLKPLPLSSRNMSSEEEAAPISSKSEDLPMRVGLGQFMALDEKRLRYIRQLGIKDILLNFYQYDLEYPHLPNDDAPLESDDEWSVDGLRKIRETVEKAGLRLNTIENVPVAFYDKIMLGKKGRVEQMDHLKNTVENMGEADIPVFGYHWMPSGVWRTGSKQGRGGAEVSAFELQHAGPDLTHDREYTEEEMWDNYEWFLRELVPVAEEAGVKMCVHPNDPPVEKLGGIPQLFRSFENYKRAMDIVDSDHHGIEFCLGCWSEMGEDLTEVIRYFGERGKIFYVHFRDVEGTVPSFHETFVDEGNYDEYEIMKLLRDVGFSGLMIPDHVPHMDGDTDWDHRGRAYAVGYLKGNLNALNHQYHEQV